MTEEELEQALRRALQPVDPGEDFVDRVAMRPDTSATERTHTSDAAGAAPSAPHERHGRRSALLGWVPVALAACAIVGIGLVRWQQETLERQRGLEARAELLQALSIASMKVNTVRAAVIREEERSD